MAIITIPDTPATIGRIILFYPVDKPMMPAIVTSPGADGLIINLKAFPDSAETTLFAPQIPHRSIAGNKTAFWDWPTRLQ